MRWAGSEEQTFTQRTRDTLAPILPGLSSYVLLLRTSPKSSDIEE